MANPASPPISLLQIGAEMAVSPPVSLSAMRRTPGGVYPNTGPNAGIPTTLPVGMLQFLGSQGTASFTASKSSNATGSEFRNEPAPSNLSVVSNTVTIFASGGSGSYTYTWAFVSGDATTAISGGLSGANKSWSRTVGKNNTVNSNWQCTVSDGVAAPVVVPVSVSLSYTTDL